MSSERRIGCFEVTYEVSHHQHVNTNHRNFYLEKQYRLLVLKWYQERRIINGTLLLFVIVKMATSNRWNINRDVEILLSLSLVAISISYNDNGNNISTSRLMLQLLLVAGLTITNNNKVPFIILRS